jgi:periplasmic protein TonB
MEVKKNPSKDIEQTKGLFLQVGLVFALFVILVAFEWKNYDRTDTSMFDMAQIIIPEEEIEITKQEEKPEPPPPPQVPDIEIVEDDVEVDDELTFDDVDQNTAIDEYYVSRVDVADEEHFEAEIFTIVEEQPAFPGGDAALMEYLGKNISYPPMAKESGIQGTVFVQFVVEPDGSVSNAKILRGIGGGCDEEAIRVVRNMPKWKPGRQRGKPVRVYFNLPIRFILQG